MSGLCLSVAKNYPKLLRLLLSVRVNSTTLLMKMCDRVGKGSRRETRHCDRTVFHSSILCQGALSQLTVQQMS
ncbi:hypothetical protein OGM63_10650 [Plectonema radiosum NIES-515]|uniref:Uncharacterized protein n=1 Tax=Plectonema radiosum NIES-515 TaxID=2986073 RepID=A0ABT3AXW1_9CYAN|nr:hypothetical protein [Plectonema radiosum]MCV3213968.1 hypothetical protein [Plectonema radiosum NIES-515]